MITAIASCTGTGTGPRTNYNRDEAIQSLISLGHNYRFWQTIFQFFLWYPTPIRVTPLVFQLPVRGLFISKTLLRYTGSQIRDFFILMEDHYCYHGSQPSQLSPCILWRHFMSKVRERRQRTLRVYFLFYPTWYFFLKKKMCDFIISMYEQIFDVLIFYYCFTYVYYFVDSDVSLIWMCIYLFIVLRLIDSFFTKKVLNVFPVF